MARGSFTFVVILITLIAFGLSFSLLSPFWNIIMNFATGLVPSHSSVYLLFQLAWDWLPAVFIIFGVVIFAIIQALNPE